MVLGATGATGKHVVQMLLSKGHKVKAVVRSKERMLQMLSEEQQQTQENIEIIEADISSLDEKSWKNLLTNDDCDAFVSCLGHTLDFRGACGSKDRRLVTNTVSSILPCIESVANVPKKFILMSSNGVANPNGQDDRRSFLERVTVYLIRHMITPHIDNEQAAKVLYDVGTDSKVEWCAVRPNDLIDGEVSDFEYLSKPKKGLFGAGATTRANVAAAMVQLLLDEDGAWQTWKYKMPVVENIVRIRTIEPQQQTGTDNESEQSV